MLSENLKTRARLYTYCQLRDALWSVKRISSSSDESIAVKKSIEKDDALSKFANFNDHSAAIIAYNEGMNADKYSQIKKRYPDLVSSNKKTPWYYFEGGGSSLEQLSKKCGNPAQYEIFYRYWSETVHVQSAADGVVRSMNRIGIRPIRFPTDGSINVATEYSTTSLVHAMRLLIEQAIILGSVRSELLQQYKRDVSPKLRSIYQSERSEFKIVDPK